MSKDTKFAGFKVQGKMVIGQRKFDAPFSFQDSLIDEARLVHVLKGHSSLVCSGETLSLKPGTTLLMKADNFINQWHEIDNDKEVHIIGFQLTSELLQQLYSSGIPSIFVDINRKDFSNVNSNNTVTQSSSALLLGEPVLLSNYMRSVIDYIQQPQVFSEALVKLKIRELVELLPSLDKSGRVAQMLGQLFTSQQPKLQAVVQAHLYTPLKLEDLAFLCHMSESTFSRKFKQIYGTSAIKYLTSKRLEKAQQLILQSDNSLTEIALDCGFEDLSYFSRVFRQHYQIAPSQLRKISN